MSSDQIISNPTIVSELLAGSSNFFGNAKLILSKGGQLTTISFPGTPNTIYSDTITLKRPGDRVIMLFTTSIEASAAVNYNVIGYVGSLPSPQTISDSTSAAGHTRFVGVYSITSSSSESKTVPILFSVGVSGGTMSTTSANSYSIMVFELLS